MLLQSSGVAFSPWKSLRTPRASQSFSAAPARPGSTGAWRYQRWVCASLWMTAELRSWFLNETVTPEVAHLLSDAVGAHGFEQGGLGELPEDPSQRF